MNAHVSDLEFIGLHPEMTVTELRYLSYLALSFKKDDHPIFLALAEENEEEFTEENDDGELENFYSLVNEYDVYIGCIYDIMSKNNVSWQDALLRDYIDWARCLEPDHRTRFAHLLFLMNQHAVNNPDWKTL